MLHWNKSPLDFSLLKTEGIPSLFLCFVFWGTFSKVMDQLSFCSELWSFLDPCFEAPWASLPATCSRLPKVFCRKRAASARCFTFGWHGIWNAMYTDSDWTECKMKILDATTKKYSVKTNFLEGHKYIELTMRAPHTFTAASRSWEQYAVRALPTWLHSWSNVRRRNGVCGKYKPALNQMSRKNRRTSRPLNVELYCQVILFLRHIT